MATHTASDSQPAIAGSASEHLRLEDRVALLRLMLMMRTLEARAFSLYRQGKVPGSFYDGLGQEAVSVGAAFAMGPDDGLCPLHRDLGAHIVRGVSVARILGQYMGRAGGVSAGHEANVHFGDFRVGMIGMVSMLGDMMPVANGLALAYKMRGEPRCALTWIGDGGTSCGDFHAALNWGAVQRLPVIYVIENNQYAYSTPLRLQFAVDPVERASAYGIPGVRVDGNDAEAVFEACRAARERAVAGEGPTLIEAVTMRMHGHAAHDDMRYVPPELIEYWSKRDPIEHQERVLQEAGVDVQELRADVVAEVDRATAEALQMAMPDAASLRPVFFEGEPEVLGGGDAPWSGWQEGHDA